MTIEIEFARRAGKTQHGNLLWRQFKHFDAFVVAFESGDVASDINGDGFLDVSDFDAFVDAFEAGC